MEHVVRPFIAVFSDVPDFRHAQGKRHRLPLVLTLVTLALINQQNTLGQIAAWVHGLGWQTRQRLHLRHNRVPSYATLRRFSSWIILTERDSLTHQRILPKRFRCLANNGYPSWIR
jgi:hypothetical protein